MKRLEVLCAFSIAVLIGCPFPTHAQQSIPVIGFLHSAEARSFAQLEAFREGLAQGGFEEGRNVAIEYRWAEGKFDRLPAMAGDLVQRKVNVIAAGGGYANLAAKRATDTIPIVFSIGSDPIKLGLVTNLGRPTGNFTGVSFFVADLVAKQLDLLHQLVPRAKTVAVLVNSDSPEAAQQPEDAREAARKLGIEIRIVTANTDGEMNRAFDTMMQMHADAIIVAGGPFFGSRIHRIVDFAARVRVPDMHYRREFVVAGGLLSYGTNLTDVYRQVGIYVTRILKGAKPAELPVIQPAKFEFAINLKTAKALGLEFHPQLLATADEVIE
jgi:putative ABC transport system substrate-binding protein